MPIKAVVSSKGEVTLPAAMRGKLGIQAGSRIHFELHGKKLAFRLEVPTSAYRGILKGDDLGSIERLKGKDRDLDGM